MPVSGPHSVMIAPLAMFSAANSVAVPWRK